MECCSVASLEVVENTGIALTETERNPFLLDLN